MFKKIREFHQQSHADTSTTQMKWSNFSKTPLSTLTQETTDNMKNPTPIEDIKISVKKLHHKDCWFNSKFYQT